MGVKCSNCGTDNTQDSEFCKKCGTQLTSVDTLDKSFTRTLETPTNELSRGTIFAGRYEIIESLGTGGMWKDSDRGIVEVEDVRKRVVGLRGD